MMRFFFFRRWNKGWMTMRMTPMPLRAITIMQMIEIRLFDFFCSSTFWLFSVTPRGLRCSDEGVFVISSRSSERSSGGVSEKVGKKNNNGINRDKTINESFFIWFEFSIRRIKFQGRENGGPRNPRFEKKRRTHESRCCFNWCPNIF